MKKVQPRQIAESLPMWHWQSKGVGDAILGLCSQECGVELPG